MTVILTVHPQNPQQRLLEKAVDVVRQGGVIAYPTDSGYALGCQIGHKNALERVRRIRHLDEQHHFTLICRNLSQLATYAIMPDTAYRLLRVYTPGAYTFILTATQEVPRRLLHLKKKTIGIRIPDHLITLDLLAVLNMPLLNTSLTLPDQHFLTAQTIKEILGHQVDLIIDGGDCALEPTTIIDLSTEKPVVLRQGKGDSTPFI